MMSRDIFSYPIPQYLKVQLIKNKFVVVKDFDGITAETLSAETGFSKSESEDVLSVLKATPCKQISAADHYFLDEKAYITTGSSALDGLLDGGIRLSKVTEICGLPGTGKTQLCLQLAINVQMPESKNGVQGEAFYVDTEGSFSCERLSEMAQGMLKAVEEPRNASNNVCEQSAVCNERVRTGDCTSCMTEMDVGMHCKSDSPTSIDSILQGVHYYRCLNLTQLLTIANILQEFLTNHRKVKLVVIDNLTYHLRCDFGPDIGPRSHILHHLSQAFRRLAQQYSLAVVLTNQMTTRISDDGQSTIVPALGDSWNHACCTRILLKQDSTRRVASVLKSSYLPTNDAHFRIESVGLRDDFDRPSVSLSANLDPHHVCRASGANIKKRRLDEDSS